MKKRSFLKNVAGTLLATAVSSSLSVTTDAAEPVIEDICEAIAVGNMSILPALRCGYASKDDSPSNGGPNVFLKDWEIKFARGVAISSECPVYAENCTFVYSEPEEILWGIGSDKSPYIKVHPIRMHQNWDRELRRFALLAQEKGTLTVHPDVDFQEWLLRGS